LKIWSDFQDCALRRAPEQEEEFHIVQVRGPCRQRLIAKETGGFHVVKNHENFSKILNILNVQVNDLTIDTVRQEFTDLETCGKLPVLQICPARSDSKKLII
jgi:hypothetical protein